jgi:hypothetical protein
MAFIQELLKRFGSFNFGQRFENFVAGYFRILQQLLVRLNFNAKSSKIERE